MTLRRQIFISFVLVALLPLLVVAFFLFWTNGRLAYDLYEENLSNSSRTQVDILTEQINRSLVRSGRFAAAEPLEDYLALSPEKRPDFLQYPGMTEELLRFTDEVQESVTSFAIMERDGQVVFSSGTSTETAYLREAVPRIVEARRQCMLELSMGEEKSCLLQISPVGERGREPQGFLLLVLSTDYFFKCISNQQSLDFSNTFLYCTNHQKSIRAKQEVDKLSDDCRALLGVHAQGHVYSEIDGKKSLLHYRQVVRTPWIVVNSIPEKQIISRVQAYGMLNILVLVLISLVIMLLSRIQSKCILQPLVRLLAWVEHFFLNQDKVLPPMEVDTKTEIGYLAEKFSGMAENFALAQMKLRESNYLYETLLNATYELHLTVDFEKNVITASHPALTAWLDEQDGADAIEKAERFLEATQADPRSSQTERMRALVRGEVHQPDEVEICALMYAERHERWYRVIFVPIPGEGERLKKVVLHFENITARKQEQLRLMESAQRDPLTGLLNKHAFTQLAEAYLRERPVGNTVFFLDLDNFKKINDSLGHATGDQVLIGVASALKKQFRPGDLVARYGGDEFVVFVPGLSRELAKEKAIALLKTIPSEHRVPDGTIIRVSASIGIYHAQRWMSLEEMVCLADEAMYQAKEAGKSRYHMM